MNAVRETFYNQDLIRVHPIVTHGGDMVNAIPEQVEMESYVRGKTYEAIVESNKKINRALVGAALSLGTNIEIIDIPGYAPLRNAKGMIALATEAAALLDIPFEARDAYSTGSTDMGDLSTFMPVIHPYAGGAWGNSHGANYKIADPESACVTSAKWQLAMLRLLLTDGGALAKQIMAEFTPVFASAAEFLAFQDSLNTCGDRIVYEGDTATVTL